MKTRIITHSGYFYPQFFNIGYWSYFPEHGYPPCSSNTVGFEKIEDAIDFLNSRRFEYQKTPKVIWEKEF